MTIGIGHLRASERGELPAENGGKWGADSEDTTSILSTTQSKLATFRRIFTTMSSLLQELHSGYESFFVGGEVRETHISACLRETGEFRMQLKKLKAHLKKNIQESKQLDVNDTSSEGKAAAKKLQKRYALIQDKIHKSSTTWDHAVKKHTKLSHQNLNKFNKSTLNKIRKYDMDSIYNHPISAEYKNDVEDAIGQHIARYHIRNLPMTSKPEVEQYMKQVFNIHASFLDQFAELGYILHELKDGKYESCWKWATETENNNNSRCIILLRYHLFVLSSLERAKTESVTAVCEYIINHFPRESFFQKGINFGSEIAHLLAELTTTGGIANLEKLITVKARECSLLFTQEFCLRNGLPMGSPLFQIVLSGVYSSQYFLKYAQIKSSAHVGWTTSNELPFDVELPKFLPNFHPVFICPVLKEETTDDNPPYALLCHHIISKNALTKLSNGGTTSIKCPYCPVVSFSGRSQSVRFVNLDIPGVSK